MPRDVYNKKPLMDRFENKVFYGSPCGCHYWIGATVGNRGYGVIGVGYKLMLAHRVSYMINVGDIPSDLCVLHKCDNRLCVNPDHLFLGTQKNNLDDMRRKGRQKYRTGKLKQLQNV